ncbi:hypothetical protein JRG66_00835 [Salinimicrobium tongyeongense]|uniref:Uncharacterized protein n=1 Tax=Salinimicrobium tongyeongense TaxID=2809707 RepID=A0ABY6NRF4_9FLAO|nr:hypothetical protein [Salinimicrobium tongyeongense]UZH55477.1 hypothetical protein JRG66_00835 [Salinimicrobium tongyeongense]
MDEKEDFDGFQKHLNVLDEDIRARALEYAAEIFAKENCTREEALERGIAKAEMDKRNL